MAASRESNEQGGGAARSVPTHYRMAYQCLLSSHGRRSTRRRRHPNGSASSRQPRQRRPYAAQERNCVVAGAIRLAEYIGWQAVLADRLLHQATVGIQTGCVGSVVAEDQEQERLAALLAWCHDGFCLVGCPERELIVLLQRPLLCQEPIKLIERIVIYRAAV